MVGRVWPRHGQHGRPLNSVVRCHEVHRPLNRIEHAVLAAIFGGLFVYALIGVTQGALYLPARGGGTHIHGEALWLAVVAPLLMWLGVLVRHGLFRQLNSRARGWVEFACLLLGLGALLMALRFGTWVKS